MNKKIIIPTKEIIFALQSELFRLDTFQSSFDYLKISIASPERIKNWCERLLPNGEIIGQVITGETINFRTHQPEAYGLFCERIFGPIKDWKCSCRQYNGLGVTKVCQDCGVEIIEARVRRYRMGYIELTNPVTHLWYFKGVPNYLMTILKYYDEDLKFWQLDEIIYLRNETNNFDPANLLANKFYLLEEPVRISNVVNFRLKQKRRGSEILKAALESIDLPNAILDAREQAHIRSVIDLKKKFPLEKHFIRRIRILESFFATKTNPSWIVLTSLPVLPPSLRPLLELKNGRLVAADVNELYRLIITRNQRLFDLVYRNIAPIVVNLHGQRLLQEGVDALIDNARLPKNKMLCLNDKPLKSLTEILEGKQGRFRQSLLGKRVDYSGRSVIIVGPQLRLNECGLPYDIAVELFQPFLIHAILKTIIQPPSHNTKLANLFIKSNKPFIWSLLVSITHRYSILLNRAPTLHRFGVQAFDPVIMLGQAIHLHPLVCTGFNADFDGDQMAVHLPLYESSQLEAKTMMRPSYNVLSPANGEVVLKPTQDMVIGCYYLTLMFKKKFTFSFDQWFSNEDEALVAFFQKKIGIHTPILIRYKINAIPILVENKKIKFLEIFAFFDGLNSKEINILKCFVTSENKKEYFITNIGVLVAERRDEQGYFLTNLFLESTPGRLIFMKNINKIFNG
jgi:DNA-directed RNA polymerase subunit beta'